MKRYRNLLICTTCAIFPADKSTDKPRVSSAPISITKSDRHKNPNDSFPPFQSPSSFTLNTTPPTRPACNPISPPQLHNAADASKTRRPLNCSSSVSNGESTIFITTRSRDGRTIPTVDASTESSTPPKETSAYISRRTNSTQSSPATTNRIPRSSSQELTSPLSPSRLFCLQAIEQRLKDRFGKVSSEAIEAELQRNPDGRTLIIPLAAGEYTYEICMKIIPRDTQGSADASAPQNTRE